MPESRLFIYGTLKPGEPNEHILHPLKGNYEEAWLIGEVFPDGWEGGSDCPGLNLNQQGEKVPGFVFTSNVLDENWDMLDEFEGEHYERVSTTVTLERCGTVVEAFVYIIKK